MKSTNLLLTLAVAGTLALVGCSGGANNASTSQSPAPAATQEKASDIKSGTEKMLAVTADLKKALDSGDEAAVKAAGSKLEEAWGPFEDKVKEKYADLYKKVEDALDPVIAGTEASPLDKAVVGKLNDQLTQALQEVADKEK